VLSLPISPQLDESQCARVCEVLLATASPRTSDAGERLRS
jgi:hypothetical protein